MTQKSKTLKPFNGFSTLINVLMGTGPILLPPVVASAGFGLSTIVLLVIMLFSIIGAEYLIEILSITN
jgi:amino acid permease